MTRGDLAKNRSVTSLWKVPAAGGEPQQLTFVQQGSNDNPRWSADGRYLYFLSTRVDDKPQVFRLSLEGGDAEQVTSFATGVSDFVLSPDGNTLAIEASVFPSCTDMACSEKLLKERSENPVKTRVITEMPFRRWDSWVDGQRNHIFTMPSAGGSATDLTPGDVDSPIWPGEAGGEEMAFSPDGREICFSRYVENESLTGNSDLFVMPVSGGTPKPITTNKSTDRTPVYSPDGRYIAYSATLRPMQETDLVRLFVYDRTTGKHRNLSEATDRSIASYVWSPDSASLYVTFENHGQVTLARLEVETALTALVTTGTTEAVDVARDGKFLVLSSSNLTSPAELFRLDLAASPGTQPVQLTHLNQDVLKDFEFGEVSSFTFKGWHGEAVQAWQVKPPQFDSTRKYPLLLLMHGGPEGEQAPITYAKNFRTPMLIIHGANDYRVDPSQGLAMFQVLRARHVPSKLVYFQAENHWVLKPADSVLWYHTVLDWLDQWVKPDREEYQRRLSAASTSGRAP